MWRHCKKDNSKLGIAVAFVELREGMNNVTGIKEELMDMAKRDLPEHMHPAEIRIIEHMPMTASGKIDYHKLEEKKINKQLCGKNVLTNMSLVKESYIYRPKDNRCRIKALKCI